VHVQLIVFSGDFRQLLPVVPKATRAALTNNCITSHPVWAQLIQQKPAQVLRLPTNMRVNQLEQLPENAQNKSLFQNWAECLLKVGNGSSGEYISADSLRELSVHIDDKGLCSSSDEKASAESAHRLLRSVFSRTPAELAAMSTDERAKFFKERAVLSPKNSDVNAFNLLALNELFPFGHTHDYLSADTIDKTDPNQLDFVTEETLNSIEESGIPPHKLTLKVGVPIVLLRNLNSKAGLANGTRLVVQELGKFTIKAKIITGSFAGTDTILPRIGLYVGKTSNGSGLKFLRRQFPVRLAFAMTIHKSQGQTLMSVGVRLSSQCFTHGQLYVALSRVGDPRKCFVSLCEPSIQNVVYPEVLTTSV
jgi:hypothetical protein